MIVPFDFMDETDKEKKTEIYLKRYEENASSKIYTKVEENLLVLVRQGSKRLIYREHEMIVSEGEFALFRKGNYIMNQILGKHKYESLLIFLSDDMLRAIPKAEIKQATNQKQFYKGNVTPYMKREADAIMELFEAENNYEDIIRLKLAELLLYIQKEDKTGEFRKFLQSFSTETSFKHYFMYHYDRYDSVQKMADAMHMSISTYKRKFEKEFGCTPHVWMIEQRLEKAVMLLCTTDYSVTDIAFLCGFSSLSAFMGQFKKKFGSSPGLYRKS